MKDIIPLKELKKEANPSIDLLVNEAIDEINKNLLSAARDAFSRTVKITYKNNSKLVRDTLKAKLLAAGYKVSHPKEYGCRGDNWTDFSTLIISFELV